jgi:translation initiation factor IF-2
MSKGTDPNTNFGRADGVSLKTYFDNQIELLSKSFCDKLKDMEDKINSTVDSNKELYLQKFSDSKEAVSNALNSAQMAITKSEIGAEKRADAVYVSLSSLQKALSEVISRGEFALSSKNADDKYIIISKLVSDLQLAQTKLLTNDAYEVRHAELQRQIADLRESRSGETGKVAGANALYGYIVGAIGIVIAIITLVLKMNAI